MKLYFAKYLPVEGEIKLGDLYSCPHKGHALKLPEKPLAHAPKMIICENVVGGGVICPDCYKVKLFLCSRDIQVGDDIYDNVGRLWKNCEDCWYKAMKDGGYGFKVIGEISSDALSYVKEADEFDDTQLGFKMEGFIQEPWSELTTEGGFKMCQKGVWKVAIKGPCGHFH